MNTMDDAVTAPPAKAAMDANAAGGGANLAREEPGKKAETGAGPASADSGGQANRADRANTDEGGSSGRATHETNEDRAGRADGEALEPASAAPASRPAPKLPDGPLPIRMLSDRLLVLLDAESAERRSAGGILIPVTASVGKRLAWAFVVAIGTNVRHVKLRERVLFDPSDRAEVEIQGQTYILLRERDLHGVAEQEDPADAGGLYL
jgi:chaperonin GroES